jgi:hypothetical protein
MYLTIDDDKTPGGATVEELKNLGYMKLVLIKRNKP